MTARHFRVIEGADAPPPANPAVRVAIATQDMKSLNAHFGAAKRFAVYDVTQDGWRFIEAHDFTEVSDQSGSHRVDGRGPGPLSPAVVLLGGSGARCAQTDELPCPDASPGALPCHSPR